MCIRDRYSTIAAGIGSLKGPLHGGANLKVIDMIQTIKSEVKDWTSVEEIDNYLCKILNKEAYAVSYTHLILISLLYQIDNFVNNVL